MASKAISVGVGIPMIVAGALIAIFLPQYDVEIASTIEFIGSLIGTLLANSRSGFFHIGSLLCKTSCNTIALTRQ